MGTLRETLTEGAEGALHLGPKRPLVYSDLTSKENDGYNADIWVINILLQGLPKDIYYLINHYINAKDIWDNVKMLLEGSELTKEDRESQLGLRDSNYDQLYAYLKQHEDGKVVIQNVYGRQNRGQGNDARGVGTAGYGEARNRVRYANPCQARQIKCYSCNDKMLLMQAQENGVTLDEEQLMFIVGGQDNVVDDDVDEQPIQDLALNTMFMANLSSTYPVYDEVGQSYDLDVLSEHVKDNAVQVVQSDVSVVPNDAYMMILNDMHEPPVQHVYVTTQTKVVDKSLTAELVTYKEQVELYERRARFELTEREQKIDE
nr:integrase, catalytic region, zinc finger, CCHC-type, peptidase aspartic, catalytic [Tanacetum cinerariifolium]